MKTSDFDYYLPEKLIAQAPLDDRTSSKMMVFDRASGETEHKYFYNLKDYLNKGDVLVFNDTKVIPARLYGEKERKNGAAIEILLLKRLAIDKWEILMKPSKRVKNGGNVIFGDGALTGTVVKDLDDGKRLMKFSFSGIFEDILDKLGNMPLPPYIKEKLEDKSRYQTVYAKYEGSTAAPTAGLHFTKEYIKKLEEKGVIPAFVTLHVGLGTFKPVSADNISGHKMHSEWYSIDEKNAEIIKLAVKEKRRVIAVGTTSLRTIEAAACKYGEIKAVTDETDIFIYPGYDFKIVSGLLTNFHLPKSTLLMLISAFSDREKILSAYKEAIKNNYRFFSFGDCMLIL